MAQEDTNTEDINFEEIEKASWTPFDTPPTKREYTKPNIDSGQLEDVIAEPIFKAPSLEDIDFEDPTGGSEETKTSDAPSGEAKAKFNPAFHELPNKEKEKSAEIAVDITLDGYGRLKKLMGLLAKVPQSKLDQEYAEGNIDPNIQLPVDNQGNTIGVDSWFKEYNKEVDEACEVDQEFKDKIKPPLVNIFKKKGFGMTDEHQVAYLAITDIGLTGASLWGLRKSTSQILEHLREETQKGNAPIITPEPKEYKTEPESNMSDEEISSNHDDHIEEEFIEPKPSSAMENAGVEIIVEDDSDFLPAEKNDNLPELGNQELLSHMENASKK